MFVFIRYCEVLIFLFQRSMQECKESVNLVDQHAIDYVLWTSRILYTEFNFSLTCQKATL